MSYAWKRELKTWLGYFVIASMSEVGAFVVFLPHCEGCEYQLSTMLRNIFESYEQPRLRTWLLLFIGLSLVRFVFSFLSHKINSATKQEIRSES